MKQDETVDPEAPFTEVERRALGLWGPPPLRADLGSRLEMRLEAEQGERARARRRGLGALAAACALGAAVLALARQPLPSEMARPGTAPREVPDAAPRLEVGYPDQAIGS